MKVYRITRVTTEEHLPIDQSPMFAIGDHIDIFTFSGKEDGVISDIRYAIDEIFGEQEFQYQVNGEWVGESSTELHDPSATVF
jgi:hypothetical protein